ncbi:hypothetical protein D3C79_1003460 [compost metagenome]
MPAASLNTSAAMCWVLPVPLLAKLMRLGFFLAMATRSATVLAWIELPTTSTLGTEPTKATGTRSLLLS